jgi:hypothetical protein
LKLLSLELGVIWEISDLLQQLTVAEQTLAFGLQRLPSGYKKDGNAVVAKK